ncbi:MAG: protein phosphatase 2C domain-containing protein [Planctomycetota bacterium]
MRFEQTIRFFSLSDVGMRREKNEDSTAVRMVTEKPDWTHRGHLFVVADGMGGHAVGELASRLAVEGVPRAFAESDERDAGGALTAAITQTNARVYRKGQSNPSFERMGTTCTALCLGPEGATIGHVGDSRVYRVRGKQLNQLTFDHSLQWELARRRGISVDVAEMYEPKNVIVRSLGPEPAVEVDIEGPFAVLNGDVYVVCSDGLNRHVNDTEIGVIAEFFPAPEAARMLINLANHRGGGDNVTVIVARVGPSPPAAGPDPTPPDPTAPAPAWLIASGVAVGLSLVAGLVSFAFAPVTAVIMVGVASLFLSLIGFRLWQLWYRRTLERPLHAQGRTSAWRAYRSADVKLTEGFVKHLMEIESDLDEAARIEEWPVPRAEYEKMSRSAKDSLTRKDLESAARSFGAAIDVLMQAQYKSRRTQRAVAND